MLKLVNRRQKYLWSGSLDHVVFNAEYEPAGMASKRHSFIVRAWAGGRYCIQLIRVDDRDKRGFARVVREIITSDADAVFGTLKSLASSPDPEAYFRILGQGKRVNLESGQ